MTQGDIAPAAFVDKMLADAAKNNVSDLYWLPDAHGVSIRLRSEGVQSDVGRVEPEYGQQCTARIKVLARLLTYRTRIAQDGVIRGTEACPDVEMRVAVMPTRYGERVAIRLLRYGLGPQFLDDLGFEADIVSGLQALIARRSGLIVLTGPTGSGKTTTIYALIRELLRQQDDPASIITIEDPIECEVAGVSQTLVKAGSKWGYAAALRAALRQDVKTLVVGEMRDREVVKVTLDAALTGHLVITTYHAGNIPSVYVRLLHQGFEPFLVASAVTGVLSQRLVPRQDGKGRAPVAALLCPDDAWRDLIVTRPGLAELRRELTKYPGADLDAVGRRMAAEGTTRGWDA